MILFIDTETNGRIRKYGRLPSTDSNHPRIVKLSYSLYDWRFREVVSVSNLIIPEDLSKPWDPESLAVHGITQDDARSSGIDLKQSLIILDRIASQADFVVSHAVNFHRPVLGSEYLRTFDQYSEVLFDGNIPWICTMWMTRKICQIPYTNREGWKPPKFSELYSHLFESDFKFPSDENKSKALAECFFRLLESKLIKIPSVVLGDHTYKDFLIQ